MASNETKETRMDRARARAKARKRTVTVRVVDTENGVQEFKDIDMVHVKSRFYNILIMEGYSSSIGQVDGTVTITSAKEQKVFENIKGFFLHKENTFHLLIREASHVE